MLSLHFKIQQDRFDALFSLFHTITGNRLCDDVIYRILGYAFVDCCEGCQRGTCRRCISLLITQRDFLGLGPPGVEYLRGSRSLSIRRELAIPHACPNCFRLWPVLETGPALRSHGVESFTDDALPQFARVEAQQAIGSLHNSATVRNGVPHAISVRASEKVCDSDFVTAVGCNTVDVVSFLRRRLLANTGRNSMVDEVAVVSYTGCVYDGNIASVVLAEHCTGIITGVTGSASSKLIYGDRKRPRVQFEAASLEISRNGEGAASVTYGNTTEPLMPGSTFTNETDSICIRCSYCRQWQIVCPSKEISFFRTRPVVAEFKRPSGKHIMDPMSDAALDMLYVLELNRWKEYMACAETALGVTVGKFLKAPK